MVFLDASTTFASSGMDVSRKICILFGVKKNGSELGIGINAYKIIRYNSQKYVYSKTEKIVRFFFMA